MGNPEHLTKDRTLLDSTAAGRSWRPPSASSAPGWERGQAAATAAAPPPRQNRALLLASRDPAHRLTPRAPSGRWGWARARGGASGGGGAPGAVARRRWPLDEAPGVFLRVLQPMGASRSPSCTRGL